jgi:SlyX protein
LQPDTLTKKEQTHQPMNDNRRLEAVEEKLAHLERAVTELSDVIVRQQREIDAARALAQRLAGQLEALNDVSGASATDFEKPPHY